MQKCCNHLHVERVLTILSCIVMYCQYHLWPRKSDIKSTTDIYLLSEISSQRGFLVGRRKKVEFIFQAQKLLHSDVRQMWLAAKCQDLRPLDSLVRMQFLKFCEVQFCL